MCDGKGSGGNMNLEYVDDILLTTIYYEYFTTTRLLQEFEFVIPIGKVCSIQVKSGVYLINKKVSILKCR